MQVFSPLGDKTDYTWQQSLKFFCIGALWAAIGSLPPVIWTVWHNYQTYSDAQDWTLNSGVAISAIGPALLGYAKSHMNLLKVPPGLEIPPEFHPEKENG